MKSKQLLSFVFSFVLFVVNFCSSQVFAQSIPPIHFTHYTTDDGLPHDVGYQMLQDNQGYLWIGTDNGLARFDGNKFRTFGEEEGLTNPYIIDLINSEDQGFYIGTWGNGIFKKNKDTIFHIPLDLISQKVARVSSFNPGFLDIWMKIGFTESSYNFYKKDGKFYKILEEKVEFQENIRSKIDLIKEFPKDQYLQIISPTIKTKNQEEIYFTSDGILKNSGFSLPINSIKPYTYYSSFPNELWHTKLTTELEPLEERLRGISITSLVEDKMGGLWLGSQSNIYYLSVDGLLTNFPTLPSNLSPFDLGIWQEKYVAFFAHEDRSRLFLLEIKSGQIFEISTQVNLSATISDIFIDQEENLWLTTDGAGLYCLKPFLTRNYTKNEGLNNSFIYDLIEARDGTIYTATKKRLYFYSQENWIKIDHEFVNS